MWPFTRKAASGGKGSAHSLRLAPIWRPSGDHSLEGSEAIFGAVTLLSNTIASMRVRLMAGDQEDSAHDLARLVSYQPNPRMDAFSFWQTLEVCRNTSGNCYALKVPGPDGQVAALDILDPERVEPVRDADTGDVWYRVRPAEGGEWYVASREMIHCRHVGAGGIKGVSPLRVLEDSLAYDDQMKTFSIEQARGVSGAVVLEFPAQISDPQQKAIIDNFLENYKRSGSSLLVLSGGVKSSTINRSPVDAKVLDIDRLTGNKVARVFNLSPMMLGDYTQTRYSSQEQQQQEFLERTVLPIVRMYEAQLNLKLLTWQQLQRGYRFAFDLSDLVAGDQKSRAELYQVMVRGGMLMPNEVRRKEGLPPAPGGDVLLCSSDLVPIAMLGAVAGRLGKEKAG